LEKRQPLQQMVSRRLKLDLCLSPCTKTNTKWIKGLTVRNETLKLWQENSQKSRYWQWLSE
jgi:hypothetical protein